MEIHINTARYTAQELRQHLNPQGGFMCSVLGGDHPNEYVIIVTNKINAKLVQGMLQHLGVEAQ